MLPSTELCTPIERLVMPIAILGITTFYPPPLVNDPNSKVAITNGQYILIPLSENTHGHGTHTWAILWKDRLQELLAKSAK